MNERIRCGVQNVYLSPAHEPVGAIRIQTTVLDPPLSSLHLVISSLCSFAKRYS